jgi:dienelactone hydrolase
MIVDRRLVLATLTASLACPAVALIRDDVEGAWLGVWTKGGDDLPVTVRFMAGPDGLAGAFDSDVLQVTGIPFAEVVRTGTRLRFVLQGDESATVLEGDVRGDEITGTLTEGAAVGRFRLERDAAPAPAVRAEELTATVGNATLSGSLLLPAQEGVCPAVVFLHGSGPEGRFANRYPAQRFAEAGFAALIFDKRGVGRSGGDWRQAGFDDLAADAAAWVRLLRTRSDVDPMRIGLYGHSQGGTIAPLAAEAVGDPAFVIASAASGLSPAETEIYSLDNSLGVPDMSPDEARGARIFVRGLVAVAYGQADRASFDVLAATFRSRDWYFEPPPEDASYWAFSDRIASYDPMARWRAVKAPVLLLYGELDERTPPTASIAAIRAALAEGGQPAPTVRVYPDADHAFRLPSRPGGWPRRVPDYARTVTKWAREKVGPG